MVSHVLQELVQYMCYGDLPLVFHCRSFITKKIVYSDNQALFQIEKKITGRTGGVDPFLWTMYVC